jgi:hypothetical protein
MWFCSAFNKCYVEDKDNFGDPANSEYEADEPDSVPEWIKKLNQYSSKVQGLGVGCKSSKRPRVDEDE